MLDDSNSVVADELLFTSDKEFFKDMTKDEIVKWANCCMDFVYEDMAGSGLKLIPFSDGEYEWSACMLTRKEESENVAVQCFRRHIQDWLVKIRSGQIQR